MKAENAICDVRIGALRLAATLDMQSLESVLTEPHLSSSIRFFDCFIIIIIIILIVNVFFAVLNLNFGRVEGVDMDMTL